MGKIVTKFGGSTLKQPNDILKIIDVIKSYNQPLIVVISAFYGVTELIRSSIELASEDKNSVTFLISELRFTAFSFLKTGIPDDRFTRCCAELSIDKLLLELEDELLSLNEKNKSSQLTIDKVLSFGERLSATTLYFVLSSIGIKTEIKLPDKIGFVTDGVFGNARINHEKYRYFIQEKLKGDYIFIIPGFYGFSPFGQLTTLGKGGSDYSASVIASCINAESLDLWKDTQGIHTADPKIFKNTRLIENLSYEEATEMAVSGAKILHPLTIEPLTNTNIQIRLFNIEDPSNTNNPFTTIQRYQKT